MDGRHCVYIDFLIGLSNQILYETVTVMKVHLGES